MAKISITKLIMDNGEEIKVEGTPDKILDMLYSKMGVMHNDFVKFGIDYINPAHVSLLRYEEEETTEHERIKVHAEFKKPEAE